MDICVGLALVTGMQEDGTTALLITIYNGHVGVVRALLARAADVTAAHVSQWQAMGSVMGEGGRAVQGEEGSDPRVGYVPV
jgi:hypothetical protein